MKTHSLKTKPRTCGRYPMGLVLRGDSMCKACGEKMPKGNWVVWVRKDCPYHPDREPGVYHEACLGGPDRIERQPLATMYGPKTTCTAGLVGEYGGN